MTMINYTIKLFVALIRTF